MNDDDFIDGQYQNYLSSKEFEEAEIRRSLEKYHTFRSPHEVNKQVPLTFVNVTDHIKEKCTTWVILVILMML